MASKYNKLAYDQVGYFGKAALQELRWLHSCKTARKLARRAVGSVAAMALRRQFFATGWLLSLFLQRISSQLVNFALALAVSALENWLRLVKFHFPSALFPQSEQQIRG
jgi:hypothetical protein